MTTRTSRTTAFGSPISLGAINDATHADDYPTLTADGLTLYFDSDRSGQAKIYTAVRPSTSATFGAAAEVIGINSGADGSAHVTTDGGTLYFASGRSGALDLYRATLGSGGVFGAPQAIGELNTSAVEADPVLTPDELTIYFTRSEDIYVAHRSTKLDGFGIPARVTELNSSDRDDPVWVSSNDCTLYFQSYRDGGIAKLYVASRP